MVQNIINEINAASNEKVASFPKFNSGDTINVHVLIKEGNKERVQQFQGVVIQRKNPNTPGETFTVRKLSVGIGVERIFPIHSPSIQKIDLVRRGKVRRAKLFYLRKATGKKSKVKERRV